MEPLTAGPYTLRLPDRSDVAWLCHSCRDPEVLRWTRLPDPYEPRHAIEFVEGAVPRAERGSDVALLIELTDSGELLGSCGLGNITADRAEVGYWLASDGRGRGAASAAVERLVALGQDLGVSLVEAYVMVGNVRSELVLARCGFVCVNPATTCEQRGVTRPATRWERRLP
jgi:RimJ/RimL family protein N-acetyltransferase